MTKFNREDFNYHGGYLTYGEDRKFVARFKYNKGDRARFVTFLIKNFTVEEFFAAVETIDPTNPWGNKVGPLTVLEAKGFISTTVRKSMKARGYTDYTTAGYRRYMEEAVFSGGDHSEYWAEVDATHAAILETCKAA